jgi:hypothetical protein
MTPPRPVIPTVEAYQERIRVVSPLQPNRSIAFVNAWPWRPIDTAVRIRSDRSFLCGRLCSPTKSI